MNNVVKEEWKDIEGYEGYYQVSNHGRIRSLDRYVQSKNKKTLKKGMIRKLQTSHKGYSTITLLKHGEYKTFQVHRLVAIAFIDNPNNKPQVNHIDCNKENNTPNNLEWATQDENMKHAVENNIFKNFSEKQRKAVVKNQKHATKARRRKVSQLTLDGEFIKQYKSIAQAEKETGTNNSKITMCCRGIRNQSNGYKWKYAETENIKEATQ
jgi:hypothetical protein